MTTIWHFSYNYNYIIFGECLIVVVIVSALLLQLFGAFVCGIFRATGVTRVCRRPIFAANSTMLHEIVTALHGWPYKNLRGKRKTKKKQQQQEKT